MGAPGPAKVIFGKATRGLLFDLGQTFAHMIPIGIAATVMAQSIVGGIMGLDGSGFSGLPLIGSLAQVLEAPSELDA